MITRAIETAFAEAERKNWNKTFWAFDIHATILKPNYKYGNIPTEFYTDAKEVLQQLTERKDVCLILYTCSHPHEVTEYLEFFSKNGIEFEYVNENPEVKTQEQGYGNYDTKFYMNVLFEDKAGFLGVEDWTLVKDCLAKHPEKVEA